MSIQTASIFKFQFAAKFEFSIVQFDYKLTSNLHNMLI